MCRCTNSFPLRSFSIRSILLLLAATLTLAAAALDARGQKKPGPEVYQKVSLSTAKPCTVGAGGGEVTALVKDGVELSVAEDWDCDGVADAYDNCVGMPNPAQTDSDRSGFGDVCEAATTVRTTATAARRPTAKASEAKTKKDDQRSRPSNKKQLTRPDRTEPVKAKVEGRKSKTKPT